VNREHLLRLRDGREVAVCESGAPRGDAIIECHGNPGSRISPLCSDATARALDIRWLTFDRPGIGPSSRSQGHRTVCDVVGEVEEICDALDMAEFSILGYSAGGPYAAACAHGMGSRVRALGLLSATPRLDGPNGMAALGRGAYWRLAVRVPQVSRAIYRSLGTLARHAPAVLAHLTKDGCSAPERRILADPLKVERLVAVLAEATRQGPGGLVDDMRTLARPWGFDPGEITTPAIIWQGDEDSFVDQTAGAWWADVLPTARSRALPGEGHFLPDTLIEELMKELKSLAAEGLSLHAKEVGEPPREAREGE
jgi:pimeloyl-ACP methyl ester carboxylesterase